MSYAKKLASGVIALALIFGVGCRKGINSSNPRVVLAVTLDTAAQATQTAATGLVAANQTIDGLETTEPEYYTHAKPALVRIAKAIKTADAAIRAAKNGDTSANWKGAVAAIATAAGDSDLTAFGFKNPNSQLIAKAGFATLAGILSDISVSFGGK